MLPSGLFRPPLLEPLVHEHPGRIVVFFDVVVDAKDGDSGIRVNGFDDSADVLWRLGHVEMGG